MVWTYYLLILTTLIIQPSALQHTTPTKPTSHFTKMRFSTSTFMALVAAVGALASPIEKKQNYEINDVTILNYACKYTLVIV